MRIRSKPAAVAVFCSVVFCVLSAQQTPQDDASSRKDAPKHHTRKADRTLTPDDGMSVIAAALDVKRHDSAHDCSHLVHTIYERAGFPYTYASSDDLYDGVEGFHRVWQPQAGDIIVWHGHAGIVVQPSRHVFFSFLTAGPATSDYYSRYWRERGEPRFYRYVKNDPCPGCASVTVLRQSR